MDSKRTVSPVIIIAVRRIVISIIIIIGIISIIVVVVISAGSFHTKLAAKLPAICSRFFPVGKPVNRLINIMLGCTVPFVQGIGYLHVLSPTNGIIGILIGCQAGLCSSYITTKENSHSGN